MDPNWEKCPYCEAERRAKSGKETTVKEGTRETVRRVTKVMPSAKLTKLSGHISEGDTRRIVGVLITYTWRPEGQLFPVREGKNFIGRGSISSEAFNRSCDVQVPEDERMSGEHTLILCRHGLYEIIDQASSNGTFLNGEMLMANTSAKIPNYAKIQTGATVWTFIQIEAPRDLKGRNDVEEPSPRAPRSNGRATRVL
jgi:pSer/pThr/pTyr-binding forkhead associated (FHA) protein